MTYECAGDTALHIACYNGSGLEVVQLLLSLKSDPSLKNGYGDSALDAAGQDAGPKVLLVPEH